MQRNAQNTNNYKFVATYTFIVSKYVGIPTIIIHSYWLNVALIFIRTLLLLFHCYNRTTLNYVYK